MDKQSIWDEMIKEFEMCMEIYYKDIHVRTFAQQVMDILFKYKHELIKDTKLHWITPEEGRESTYNKLYLAYQPGYPLMVADWKTGHGYRNVRTGEGINPKMVAYIDVPSQFL